MSFSLALVQGADMEQVLDAASKGFGTGVVTGGIATFGAHYVSAKQNGIKAIESKDLDKGNKKASDHNFKYSDKVRMRAVQDPLSHNFPYSFDEAILATNPIMKIMDIRFFN